jgi:transposase
MMGYQPPPDDPLFSYNVQLETRVRKDHPLRRIRQCIDFEFIYKEVAPTYGASGNVSVPPTVILKLMLLLVLYNVRSERELMETIPERLDWLWFLDYTIETMIPDHSVLSKARKRWGEKTFRRFFQMIVSQCVEAGLVNGDKIFVDSSFIDAAAARGSLVERRRLEKASDELEKRLEDHPRAPLNNRYVSSTDPDASMMRHGENAHLRYKTHRAVDEAHEIITAVEVTPGIINEAVKLADLLDAHHTNTGIEAATVVADMKYGIVDNFLACNEREVDAHIKPLADRVDPSRKDIFPIEAFTYDAGADAFTCPAGKVMKRQTMNGEWVIYAMRKTVCRACHLKERCTKNKSGRMVRRHIRQDILTTIYAAGRSRKAKRNLRIRQHLMERSFALSAYFGMKRARWRRLWRVQIQEYLIASVQNIRILLNATKDRFRGIRNETGRLGGVHRLALQVMAMSFHGLIVVLGSGRKLLLPAQELYGQ